LVCNVCINSGPPETVSAARKGDYGMALLSASSGYGFKLRDLWAHEDIGVMTGGINEKIEAYGCKLYKATLTKI
jgi:hypothetical protein